ncbi:hypothetical protein I5677_04390 [Mobilitalea sibirica]|uniref:Uncharacterized protein n=1 Tax=Mobilitalea sibirica TaxID=1462919 RepID=A0A8J7L289_9FIRM|nr:hypothetical protein [Mobilitalea sibirica]MBH1940133.1 hypothetical protein [Mobilitalea sibirica]
MNSCELVSTITALACAIAKCVPEEELPILTAALGQLASTLATITVKRAELTNDTGNNNSSNSFDLPPVSPSAGEVELTLPPFE